MLKFCYNIIWLYKVESGWRNTVKWNCEQKKQLYFKNVILYMFGNQDSKCYLQATFYGNYFNHG